MSIFQECDCVCCDAFNGFPILWELSKNVFWFEIPKNGSTSIKKHFGVGVRPNDSTAVDAKRPITDYAKYQTIVPYAIMRDPVARFTGTLKHYFSQEGQRYHTRGVKFFKRQGYDIEAESLQSCADFVIDNLEKLTSDDEVHHFYPQTHFLDNTFKSFNLIRMNEISPTFDVGHRNKTATKRTITLTPEQEQYIKDVYKQDYEFFQQHNFIP